MMEGVLYMEFQGVSARNQGQDAALKILNNHKPYTFLTGPAGTGKTLLTGAVGLEKVVNHPKDRFKKVIYTRLQVQTGANLGYIPGDFAGKTDPFVEPFKDNFQEMEYTLPLDHLQSGTKNKKLEFVPIQTMRGRTIPNAFIIIDEAQNLDMDTITTLATRLGQESKMIFLSNFAQIDDETHHLKDPTNNGLYQMLSRLYSNQGGHKYFDHVHLTDIERSDAAAFIEKIMRTDRVHPTFLKLEDRGIPTISKKSVV
ncbi:hypothetical protein COA18_04580 [Priestia megaterium]|nr:hypothetical protein COA18_04580 [Priestia megaterium]